MFELVLAGVRSASMSFGHQVKTSVWGVGRSQGRIVLTSKGVWVQAWRKVWKFGPSFLHS